MCLSLVRFSLMIFKYWAELIFVDNNATNIISETGDSEQLKPVNEITNQTIYYGEHMDSVMSQAFIHEVCFKQNNNIF
jgi:hypothetical protein